MKFSNPLLRISLFLITFVAGFLFTLTVRVASGVRGSDPIPVALSSQSETQSPIPPITVDLQWGGFYAYKQDGQYNVFRLLDITPEKYHITSFDRTFREIPSIHSVSFLIPKKEHVVLDSTDFLRKAPVLLGNKRLTLSDLSGYSQYLLRSGFKNVELVTRAKRMINLSGEAPLKTKLIDINGKLEFEQANY